MSMEPQAASEALVHLTEKVVLPRAEHDAFLDRLARLVCEYGGTLLGGTTEDFDGDIGVTE